MKSELEIQKAAVSAAAFFDATDREDEPLYQAHLTAHKSLAPLGFVWVIGIICGLFLIPLLIFLGSLLLWGILIPIVLTVGGLWFAIHRNNIDRSISDNIRIWPNLMAVERFDPNGETHYWLANPHWIKMIIKDTPSHKNYLTVTGGGREIEIGSFLTGAERSELHYKLLTQLRLARSM